MLVVGLYIVLGFHLHFLKINVNMVLLMCDVNCYAKIVQ